MFLVVLPVYSIALLFYFSNSICVCSYPDLKNLIVLLAHPANCICIELDPKKKCFATRSADALISLWHLEELICIMTLSR